MAILTRPNREVNVVVLDAEVTIGRRDEDLAAGQRLRLVRRAAGERTGAGEDVGEKTGRVVAGGR